jgi:hypothetical protein
VIKVLGIDGRFLSFVGGFGGAPGEFRYPSDIVTADDSTLFILERNGARIQKFHLTPDTSLLPLGE